MRTIRPDNVALLVAVLAVAAAGWLFAARVTEQHPDPIGTPRISQTKNGVLDPAQPTPPIRERPAPAPPVTRATTPDGIPAQVGPARPKGRDVQPVDPAHQGGADDLDAKFVRSSIADAIEQLPDIGPLSEDDLDRLTEATGGLRTAQAELRSLPKTAHTNAARKAARERIQKAIVDFTEILGIGPAEFSRRLEAHTNLNGISASEPHGPVLIRPIKPEEERP